MQFPDVVAQWQSLSAKGERLTAVEAAVCDRNYLLRQFLEWAEGLSLRLYFWNSACEDLRWVVPGDRTLVRLEPTGINVPNQLHEALPFLGEIDQDGIFVIEGVAENFGGTTTQRCLQNLYYDLQQQQTLKHFVFIGEEVSVPLPLHSLIPALEYQMPTQLQVRDQVSAFFWREQDQVQDTENIDQQRAIVQACVGLPRGEIERVLYRYQGEPPEAIADQILTYKRDKLRGRGITLLPEPDVPMAAGMDLLDRTLDQIRLLLQPEAQQRRLRAPKSVLLWGIPGTGKSLAAKLAAKRIGGSLISADWNGLVGDSIAESMRNIDYLLQFVGQIGNSVLFFDEFEKAFAGWDESGQLSKLAARLLSWMNDHTEPCVMFATINHLEMLPPEMIRRFEIIHFFGLPHAGALHEIFKLHLDKHFEYDFSLNDWHLLLREYRGCTPAEVMKSVTQVANRRYFRDVQAGKTVTAKPEISLDELLEERENFVPDASKREISDQIAGILNKADYALPVQGPDTSIFARAPQRLMGIDENIRRQQRGNNVSPQGPALTHRPEIEDI